MVSTPTINWKRQENAGGANICTKRNVQIHASSDHFQTHHAGGVNSCTWHNGRRWIFGSFWNWFWLLWLFQKQPVFEGANIWTLSRVSLGVLNVQEFTPIAQMCRRGECLDKEYVYKDHAQCPNLRPSCTDSHAGGANSWTMSTVNSCLLLLQCSQINANLWLTKNAITIWDIKVNLTRK